MSVTAAKEPELYLVYPSWNTVGLCVEIREFSGFDSYTYRAAAHGPVRLETLANAFEMQLGLHYEADEGTLLLRAMIRRAKLTFSSPYEYDSASRTFRWRMLQPALS